jgi:uncharacterized protein
MSGSVTFGYEQPLEQGMAQIVVASLGASDARERLEPLFDEAAQLISAMIADKEATEPPPKPLACGAGCAFCCTMFEVHVLPIEVLRIADFVAKNFSEEDLVDLIKQIRRTTAKKADAPEPKDGGEERFSCPLLKGGLCSVYEIRPMTCRGFNSYDAENCRLGQNIDGYVHPQRITQYVLKGFRKGFAEIGLDADFLDLAPALEIALSDGEAGQRWLSGEPVFAPAQAQATGG